MAARRRFVCMHCAHALDAWDDGNPYYLDVDGTKQYAYHPDHQNRARCLGNDVPHLCGTCGAGQLVDSRDPHTACLHCGRGPLLHTFALDGKPCPFCKQGVFQIDPSHFAIS